MTSIHSTHPIALSAKPGKACARHEAAASRLAAKLWSVLCSIGARRARKELLQLAQQHEQTRPEFADQLRRVAARGWAD